MTARSSYRSPLVWLAGVLVLYMGYPLVSFVVRLISSPQRGFHSPGLLAALWVSMSAATISLVIVTALGVPLAYLLARSTSRLASVVSVVVHIPLAMPPLMSGVLLVYVVGPYTFLGKLFGEHLTDSLVGVVIAMSFVSAPFLIVSARAAFSSLDPSHADVAATLGHRELSRFMRVAVPEAGPSIRAGMLLAWLRAFGEFGAVIVLAYNPASLPIYTYNQFSGRGLPTTLAPTALALAVAVVAVGVSRVRMRGPVPGMPVSGVTMSGTPMSGTPVSGVAVPGVAVSPTSASTEVRGAYAPGPNRATPVGFAIDYDVGSFHLGLDQRPHAARLAVIGPSGSGKTALLRCVAGLYGSAPGRVYYGDDEVSARAVEQRRVGYVAQGFSLFPHLSVWRQVMFAKGSTPALAAYWMEHLQLTGLEDRLPSQLSGGQRQRVGLAQVLCSSPRVLLLDEPFSALDVPVRLELRRELRRLQRETNVATVLVTHDPHEAAYLADELMIIANGSLLQRGPTRDVFDEPGSLEIARLLGVANVHRATVDSPTTLRRGPLTLDIAPTSITPGTQVWWRVRRRDVLVTTIDADEHVEGRTRGDDAIVTDVIELGTSSEIVVRVGDELELHGHSPTSSALEVGDVVRVRLEASSISLWRVSNEFDVALSQ